MDLLRMALVHFQIRPVLILLECGYGCRMNAQDLLNSRSWLVAAAQPDDSRRRAQQCGHLGKVGILGNEREAIGLGVIPDGAGSSPSNLI